MKKSRVQNSYMTIQHKTKSTIDKSQVDKSQVDKSQVDKSQVDKSQADKSMIVTKKKYDNMINKYVRDLVRSESDLINPDLRQSIVLLSKGAFYYPHCVCDEQDTDLFKQIVTELEQAGELKIIEWSQHYKIENPKCSQTFNKIIEQVANIFNATICETRLNYYKDQSDWKPLHHDSHAYGNETLIRENFTIGISLGATRELVFMHEKSGNKFKFPQKNGDVFAFDQHVNKDFLHGVTKSMTPSGPRISLIAWCKLRDED